VCLLFAILLVLFVLLPVQVERTFSVDAKPAIGVPLAAELNRLAGLT